jgi:hypothetical protein
LTSDPDAPKIRAVKSLLVAFGYSVALPLFSFGAGEELQEGEKIAPAMLPMVSYLGGWEGGSVSDLRLGVLLYHEGWRALNKAPSILTTDANDKEDLGKGDILENKEDRQIPLLKKFVFPDGTVIYWNPEEQMVLFNSRRGVVLFYLKRGIQLNSGDFRQGLVI